MEDGELLLFLRRWFLFKNLENIRSHADNLPLIVGIGGLGIIRAVTRYNKEEGSCETDVSIPLTWNIVKCNQQKSDWECGYYVLKYMYHFAMDYKFNFPQMMTGGTTHGRGGRPPAVPPVQEQDQGPKDIPMGHDDHVGEQRRGWRPNIMWDTPFYPDARFEVVLVGKEFAQGKVIRQISKASKSLFKGSWPTWKKVDPMYRAHMWWVFFESKFKWHSDIDRVVREAWNDTMTQRFKDFMHDGREAAKRRYTQCTGR